MEGAPDWVEVDDFEAFKNTFKNHPEFIQRKIEPQTQTRTSEKENSNTPKPYEIATAGKRLMGFVIYLIIVLVNTGILDSALSSYAINYTGCLTVTVVVMNLITYKLFSGNIGHVILGMKVVKADTMEDFNNPVFSLAREIIKSILLAMFFIIYALMIFDKRNQIVYDKLLNTIVVNKGSQYNSSFREGSL
jgi:uncharacterized RDD family membrane protein YckC